MKQGASRRRSKFEIAEAKRLEAERKVAIDEKLEQYEAMR